MSALRHLRLIAVLRKEALQIVRDRRSLAIAVLQPVLLLFLYGYGVSSDINNVSLGVVDWSHSQQSRNFVKRITASGYFTEVFATDRYRALGQALDSGRIAIGLVIPANFGALLDQGTAAPVQILADGTDPATAQTVTSYVQSISASYSSDILLQQVGRAGLGAHPQGVPPLDLRLRIWFNEDLKSVVFIVPGLIVIILMMTSAILTAGTISRERERGTFEQLVASPIKPYELMLGKLLAYAALSSVDVCLVVLVGTLWFGVPLRGSVLLLALCSLLFLVGTLGIGLLVSAAIPNQRTATMIASTLTTLPSVMLSGFYFPIASMPRPVQLITTLVPARYFMDIVRGIFLKGAGVQDLLPQIASTAIFGIALLAGCVLLFKKRL